MQTDRHSVFDQRSEDGGSGVTVGESVMGRNLATISDHRTRQLFFLLGSCPEDATIPIEAVELIWRAADTGPTGASGAEQAPLSKLSAMALRTSIFTLLDRSLLNTDGGKSVQMHDIVRE